MFELLAVICYFSVVLCIGISSYSKKQRSDDFIIGSRSLNYWVTALAAHASDMSSWLFMAYPAMIFTFGLQKAWIAVGLTVCMYLNWHFVARRVRVATEKSGTLTFFSYLGERFVDTKGTLRLVTALICFVFYTVYIAVGLIGLGLVIETLFGLSYNWAVFSSILIALPYVLIGGYVTLAWIDLFQGLFLLGIILFVPCVLLSDVGGWQAIVQAGTLKGISLSLVPDMSLSSVWQVVAVMLGWGLGYFGQPTIITKFMGIKDPDEIVKSKRIGMAWMVLSLAGATCCGLVAMAFFSDGLVNPEMAFISLVQESFHPFLIGLILCAVIAASINVMCSQILVLCSTFTEDIYKRIMRPHASSSELLQVSRVGAVVISLVAFVIAYYKVSTIYTLVLYAWSGLGASFGPILIYSLYSKRTNSSIAWAGILGGSITTALWPLLDVGIDPIIVGFLVSFLSIWSTARLSQLPIWGQA